MGTAQETSKKMTEGAGTKTGLCAAREDVKWESKFLGCTAEQPFQAAVPNNGALGAGREDAALGKQFFFPVLLIGLCLRNNLIFKRNLTALSQSYFLSLQTPSVPLWESTVGFLAPSLCRTCPRTGCVGQQCGGGSANEPRGHAGAMST